MKPASAILYSAQRALTPQHQPIKVGEATIYVRAVSTALDIGAALDAAEPLAGETVLNSIPLEPRYPGFMHLTAAGQAVDADSEAVAIIVDVANGREWAALPLCDGRSLTHAEAMKAAADLQLVGGGWQLMSIAEWDTVKDLKRYEPAVKEVFHRWPSSGWCWTRDDVADPVYRDYAWGVYLGHGHSDIYHRGNLGLALVCRPVPGAASSPRQ